MNFRSLSIALLLSCLALASSHSQTPATSADSPADALQTLVAQIRTKLRAGPPTAASLAPELAAFDALLAKYRGQKSEDVARILLMKAALHGEVLDDLATMKTLFEQLKTDFPGTDAAAIAEQTLQALESREKAQAASAALVGKAAPPLNFQWSTRDGLKTLADLKGKVVVLDFWATWCGPCISSFPQVRELTAHYQGLDVVVLGVTSIQGSISGLQPQRIDTKGDPQKEFSLMADFIKAKDVTWTVVFSKEEVFNPDYGITGIPHMAIVAPDGTLRHTGLHPTMPHAEKTEMIDALLKEFKLPTAATPGAKKS